jgi:hypothetical protein
MGTTVRWNKGLSVTTRVRVSENLENIYDSSDACIRALREDL